MPLLSHPLANQGQTAREIFGAGPILVSHETTDMIAYESITRSKRGEPNVFTSREETAGETALHGEGFYVRLGREGARGGGITIRFHLDPNAREGEDFILIPSIQYLVIKNRRAIRVVDETVALNVVDYFRFLSQQPLTNADRGVWKMMELQIRSELQTPTKEETRTIIQIALDACLTEIGTAGSTGAAPIRHLSWITSALWDHPEFGPALRKKIHGLSVDDHWRILVAIDRSSGKFAESDPFYLLVRREFFALTSEISTELLEKIDRVPISLSMLYLRAQIAPLTQTLIDHLQYGERHGGFYGQLPSSGFETYEDHLIREASSLSPQNHYRPLDLVLLKPFIRECIKQRLADEFRSSLMLSKTNLFAYAHFFGNPALFDQELFSQLLEVSQAKQNGKYRTLLNAIYLLGYGRIEIFHKRWDLVSMSLAKGGILHEGILSASEEKAGLAAINHDFHEEIGLAILYGSVFRSKTGIAGVWQETEACVPLLQPVPPGRRGAHR